MTFYGRKLLVNHCGDQNVSGFILFMHTTWTNSSQENLALDTLLPLPSCKMSRKSQTGSKAKLLPACYSRLKVSNVNVVKKYFSDDATSCQISKLLYCYKLKGHRQKMSAGACGGLSLSVKIMFRHKSFCQDSWLKIPYQSQTQSSISNTWVGVQ